MTRVLEWKRKNDPLTLPSSHPHGVVYISKIFLQKGESKCQQGFAIYSQSIWTLTRVRDVLPLFPDEVLRIKLGPTQSWLLLSILLGCGTGVGTNPHKENKIARYLQMLAYFSM